jgi:hypothetical protein
MTVDGAMASMAMASRAAIPNPIAESEMRRDWAAFPPQEYICKIWRSEPDRFILDPIHQMPELNT